MNILVTGGSGFIGTHLVSDLVNAGHKVIIYDKRRSETYPDFSIVCDIRDKEKLADAMGGVDVVYHLAAAHHDNVHPVSLYYDINVTGAKNIVYGLEKHSINNLIFTSSTAVYGLSSEESREDSPIRPFNAYSRRSVKKEAKLIT